MVLTILKSIPIIIYWLGSLVLSFLLMLTTYFPALLLGLFFLNLPWYVMWFPGPTVLALFVFRKHQDLPWFLAWFGQWDDNLRAVREGTNWTHKWYVSWLRSFPDKIKLPVVHGAVSCICVWLEAMLWIIRNPGQFFDYWVCGQTIKPIWREDGNNSFILTVKGNPEVGDKPIVPGWRIKILGTGDRNIYDIRGVFKIPFTKIYFHLWGGWQFPDTVEEIKGQTKAQIKATIGLVW